MAKAKVLVVDDSLTIRAMLDTLIAREAHLEICGVAGSAEEALDLIGKVLPHIILLDMALPGMDGLSFLREIHSYWRHMDVIIVSSSAKAGATICSEAFELGAVACFDKARVITCSAELIDLMKEIANGKVKPRRHNADYVTLPARTTH